jgi:regulator of cell morphogenesis and NO signaling
MISATNSPKSIISYNRNIDHLFGRYNIGSDSTKKLDEICQDDEINIDLLLDLINCYDDLDFLKKTSFEEYSIPDLIDYLEKSHQYYLLKRIPEIEQSLEKLTQQESFTFNYVLLMFFKEYKKDIISHFKTEDEILFPFCKVLHNYIQKNSQEDLIFILENQKKAFSIMRDHQQNKDGIDDLQNVLLKYSPNNKKLSYFEIFLNQMSVFQHDLKIHAEIEENILVKKTTKLLNSLGINDV